MSYGLPLNMPQRPRRWVSEETWREIRLVYMEGRHSCRELAEQFGLHSDAVYSRCKRENWRGRKTDLEDKFDRKVEQALTRRAESMADRAERFVKRSIDEADGWLDQIQMAKKLLEQGDVDKLHKLIAAWRMPIAEGRRAYGLDNQANNSGGVVELNVALMSQLKPELITTADGKTYAEIQEEMRLRNAKSPPRALPKPEPVEED